MREEDRCASNSLLLRAAQDSRAGAPAQSVALVAAPHPFRTARREMAMPAGPTLAEMLAAAGIPEGRAAWVTVGEVAVPADWWGRVRPKAGQRVTVRALPGETGGGGEKKDVTRTVLSIAVLAASFYVPQLSFFQFGGFSIAGKTLFAGQILAGAVTSFVGSALVNAVAPPPKPRAPEFSGGGGARDPLVPAITGVRNTANPYGAIPRVLGQRRLFPPLGAQPYTEIVGADQYLRMLFVVGYGPLQIDDIRIGATPIGNFAEVETEIRQGYAADAPIGLFSNDVAEDSFSIQLTQAGGWVQRTALQASDELSVDITFPNGLTLFSGGGSRSAATAAVEVEYSPTGAGTWTAAGTITATDNSTSTVRRGLRWAVTAGSYDVRLRRVTADSASDQLFDDSYWTALRAIAHVDPIKKSGLAKIALRIKATGQLSGVIDQLSCVATSILNVWDGAAWSEQATRDPAWCYCEVLTGAAAKEPMDLTRVEADDLKAWAAANAAGGRCFDAAVDSQTTAFELLHDIAAVGRARFGMKDGRFSVVRDLAQAAPVQHFTPRNSWGFEGERAFAEQPHAVKCQFVNPTADWQQDEVIVYADGYNADGSGGLTAATRFETMQLYGVTDADQAWKDGRYHMAQSALRRESWSLFTDIEHIVCTRGDMVLITHDVLLIGLGSARLKSVTLDGGGDAASVELDEIVAMEAGKSYALSMRTVGDAGLVAAVDTVPGETAILSFTTPIPAAQAPLAGDLCAFGEAGTETVEAIVKNIEPGRDLTARLVLAPHAPEVHDADTGTIPPFQSAITTAPGVAAPSIAAVRSDETVMLRAPDGSLQARIVIDLQFLWAQAKAIDGVEMRYRRSDSPAGAWTHLPAVPIEGNSVAIDGVEELVAYDVELRFALADGTRSGWTATSETVVGKTSPASDPTGFTAQQNGAVVVFKWTPNSDLDHGGSDIRYGKRGASAWASAVPLTQTTKGTQITTAAAPPGDWTFYLKHVDTGGRSSAVAATYDLAVASSADEVVAAEAAPRWVGASSGFVRHWTGALLPASAKAANQLTNAELFEQFVPYPVAECLYESPEIDLGMDAPVRIWADIAAALGPGVTDGVADPVLEIDYRTEAGSYGGWRSWTVGTVTARYVKTRIRLTPATGNAKVTGFRSVVDAQERTERAQGVSVPAGGIVVAFAQPFHAAPTITVSPEGGLIPDKSGVSASGFSLTLRDNAGAPQAGTTDWEATGT